MKVWIVYLMILFPGVAFAQNVYQRMFNVQNGLAQSQVYALHQDENGTLWIGTAGGGVNIYNGRTFDNITTSEGLISNLILSLAGTAEGIYIGTDKGLSVYTRGKITSYTTDQGLCDNKIWKIYPDASGKIYLGTSKGVSVMDAKGITTLNIDTLLSKSAVHAIVSDKKGVLWFGTKTNGLFRYDGKSVTRITEADSLINPSVRALCFDTNQNLWIGTEAGCFIYDGSHVLNTGHKSTVLSLWPTEDGKVWVGAFTQYIACFQYKDSVFKSDPVYSLRKINTRTMLIDREGSIWLGTETGLVQIPFRHILNVNADIGLHSNNVYCILPGNSADELWVGADANGVVSYNRKREDRFRNFSAGEKKLVGSSVYAIMKDSRKRVWFATFNGVSVLNPADSVWEHYAKVDLNVPEKTKIIPELPHKAFFSLYEDIRGVVWAGTPSGVCLFTDTGVVTSSPLMPDLKGIYVYSIMQDKLGNYWFGTSEGAMTWNGKKLTVYNAENGFVDGKVNSVDQDKFGNMWFATKEGAVMYNGYEFKKIDKTNGLASNNLYSLKYDGNQYLYIGTDKGLDKLDIVSYKQIGNIQITHYGLFEGFLGVECNLNALSIDSAGRILVGTVDGFNIYDPRLEKRNAIVPKTRILKILMNFKEFDFSPYCTGFDSLTGLPQNLKLPYNINHLSFLFNSNSLLVPEKVLYRYRMVGVDSSWTPAFTKNEADFPTLQPGKYSFEVISCNNDGVWSDQPTVFAFEIMPPFYLTWWFIASTSAVLLILIFLAIKYREANLRKEKRILEERVLERTQEIAHQKNIVEQKNKDITDSINYAKNIQEALLPARKEINRIFPDNFVIYRPRDIVSGDFYWIAHKNDRTYFAVADCTGHGVPGAFMSLLGIAFLDEIIASHPDISPAGLLNMLRDNVIESFKHSGSKDGMDISLIMVEWEKRKVYWSGANNPLYFVRNNVLKEIKAQKMPIGYYPDCVPFEQHELELSAGDTVYLFSDGLADQFGGPAGKKFKYKTLRELLTSVGYLPMVQQKDSIEKSWMDWKGEYEQVDDIILIGIRFSEAALDNPEFKTT